jgi:hypothetical protein
MADKTPDKIAVSVPRGPRESESKVEVDLAKATESLAFSKDTIMYILYLMYKSNMISRTNLKQIFRIIDQKMPADVAKYLLEEAAKG